MSISDTSKIALMVSDDDKLADKLKSKSYYDERIFNRILSIGKQIPAKEIADHFKTSEASVSRSWKVFKEKIAKKRSDHNNHNSYCNKTI